MSPSSTMQPHLAVTYVAVVDLKSFGRTTRTHSKKQIGQIARSIREFGFNCPVLVDDGNTVVSGHGRLAAARELGLQTVPVIHIGHLTKAQLRAFAIADNKIAEGAEWDQQALKLEFMEILELDTDFDLTVTGFEIPEIDLIVLGDAPPKDEECDTAGMLQIDPVSRKGDLWHLGPHRIICGDALKREDYIALITGEKADMIFTDPPYNVRIQDIVSTKHAEFSQASGEMSRDEFTAFLRTTCTHMAAFSHDGSVHYICMDWRHLPELFAAGEAVYSELLNFCVWNKTNGGMGSLYRSKHEEVLVFKNGMAPHVNNIQLGKYGRYRTNVWDYAGQNTFHADRDEELGAHPTVKPVALVADAILDCSRPNDIILDPFGGSGTTLLAAEKTGRQGRLIEFEPAYVDLTIRRWQKMTRQQAIHAATGKTFEQTEQEVRRDV